GSSAISGRGKGSGGDSGAASAVFSSGAGSGAGVAAFGVLSTVGPISSEASRPRGGGACCGAGARGVSRTTWTGITPGRSAGALAQLTKAYKGRTSRASEPAGPNGSPQAG